MKALELIAAEGRSASEAAAKRQVEKTNLRLEIFKTVLNPTLAAALIGIVTLLITNSFNHSQSLQAAANQLTLEQVRAEIAKAQNQQAADATLQLEKQKFQFDIVKTALADSKATTERALALRFFTDVGLLDGLDDEKITQWLDQPDLELPGIDNSGGGEMGVERRVPRRPVDPAEIEQLSSEAAASGTAKWMESAISQLGVVEIPGRDSSADIMEYARELNIANYSSDEIDWSGLFVAWVLSQAQQSDFPASPLANRAWLEWGREVSEPQFGALAVFWRGSPEGFLGHAGFIVAHDEQTLTILGGNQNDAVQLTRLGRDKVLGYRMPPTVGE